MGVSLFLAVFSHFSQSMPRLPCLYLPVSVCLLASAPARCSSTQALSFCLTFFLKHPFQFTLRQTHMRIITFSAAHQVIIPISINMYFVYFPLAQALQFSFSKNVVTTETGALTAS
jgi:hypothetical protein